MDKTLQKNTKDCTAERECETDKILQKTQNIATECETDKTLQNQI